MSAHFELAHDNWRSTEARIFADELRQAQPVVRDKISRQFGLSLAYDSEGIRVDYDGRKVGFGSFSSAKGGITFSISPKVDDFDVKALFTCIDSLDFNNRIVQFENSQNADVHQEQEGAFSWAFLLGLLEEINDFGIHNFLIFNSKKIIKGRSSIVGKPMAKSLVLNMAHGFFGVDCEVLDNYRQRQYASLFYFTAKSIYQDLVKWQAVIKRSDTNLKGIFNSIATKLKQFSNVPFSPNLLRELSHPPFTYGVKSLLMRCIRYWQWKGLLATSNSRNVNKFWSVSIALDNAFELYAGHMIEQMLKDSKKIPKGRYSYSFDFKDPRYPGNRIEREIEPDHIYIFPKTDDIVIAEIKYSNHIAVREHVAQLISYLKYDAFQFSTNKKVGLLVYPGTVLTCKKIPCFDANIYLLTLPAKVDFIGVTPSLDLKLLLTQF